MRYQRSRMLRVAVVVAGLWSLVSLASGSDLRALEAVPGQLEDARADRIVSDSARVAIAPARLTLSAPAQAGSSQPRPRLSLSALHTPTLLAQRIQGELALHRDGPRIPAPQLLPGDTPIRGPPSRC